MRALLFLILSFAVLPSQAKLSAMLRAVSGPRLPYAIVGCTASLQYSPCANAYDGTTGTAWVANANDGWIELDLGSVKSFSKIKLNVTQSPDGWTNQYIYAGNSPNPNTEISHHFDYTVEGQVQEWTWGTAITARYVRVYVASSPSWVAWAEITIYP